MALSNNDYHIYNNSTQKCSSNVNMEKIINILCKHIDNNPNIKTYYIDELRDYSLQKDTIIESIRKNIETVDENIYCVKYITNKYELSNIVLIFCIDNDRVKTTFAVKSYSGILIDDNTVSVLSSNYESYGTIYGRIDIDRKTLRYKVREYEFVED